MGGVSLANLAEYFTAGAAAVGVSSSLFGGKALREKNLEQIGENVKNFIEHVPFSICSDLAIYGKLIAGKLDVEIPKKISQTILAGEYLRTG